MMKKIKGYIECAECGQIFYQTHLNQKFCCLDCADQAAKRNNNERFKKYLKDQHKHQKHLIRMATDRLYKKGKLEKHSCCQCGSEDHVEAHHPYYDESCISVVVWLCKHCHQDLHRRLENE